MKKISPVCRLAVLLAMGGPVGVAHADKPAAPAAAPVAAKPTLDASHIVCGEQYKADPRSKVAPLKQCEDAANAFYTEEWQAQIKGLLAASPRGFAAIRPATTFALPDGTLVGGAMLAAYAPTIFGPTAAQVLEITQA